MNIEESILVFNLASENNFSDLKVTSNIKHFIADLRGVSFEVINKIKDKFITFDQSIDKSKSSFLIVCEFSFDDDLRIVPTLQEAYDFIEMEEIERQLEL